MKHKKTVHVLGYEFDSLPAHVKLTGRGSGATLRVACQRAIADLFTQHQLRHKQTGEFKLSVVVIAERTATAALVDKVDRVLHTPALDRAIEKKGGAA